MVGRQPRIWVYVVWEILSFSMLLSGLASGNVVTMIVGAAMAFAFTSGFLTNYVKSEHRIKRISEIVALLVTLAIVVYGYAITRSFILGFMTFFIVVTVFIAFMLSYLLPRIRGEPTSYNKKVMMKEEATNRSRRKENFAFSMFRM